MFCFFFFNECMYVMLCYVMLCNVMLCYGMGCMYVYIYIWTYLEHISNQLNVGSWVMASKLRHKTTFCWWTWIELWVTCTICRYAVYKTAFSCWIIRLPQHSTGFSRWITPFPCVCTHLGQNSFFENSSQTKIRREERLQLFHHVLSDQWPQWHAIGWT